MTDALVEWPREFADRYRRKGYWAGVTLGGAFDRARAENAQRIAVVEGDHRYTYADLGAKIDRLARAFAHRGIARGKRVLLQLPNCVEFIVSYFACLKVGAVPVACQPHHRQLEIKAIARATEASAWVFATSHRKFDFVAFCEELRPSLPHLEQVFVVGNRLGRGMTSLAELLERPEPDLDLAEFAPHPEVTAVLQLSGGTTSVPKLIPRTHADYHYNSIAYGRASSFGADDVLLLPVPIAHNFPLRCLQTAFFAGARVVLAPSPSPDVVLPLVERERVTYAPAVPATVIEWASSAAATRCDTSSLRSVYVGGQRLNPEAARLAIRAFGPVIRQSFGMAEGLECCSRPGDALDDQVDTQGRPISEADELRIVDDDGRPVAEGEVGELQTRGPYTIRGYYRAERHNRIAFTSDGFYRTGDLVRMHRSGNLVVEGRTNDVINRGGEKINAEDVEAYILAHPSVANVAVVAVPDDVLGERACACVVMKPGNSMTLVELTTYLVDRVKLSPKKLPERLDIRASLPLTGVGKVSKVTLREELRRRIEEEARARLDVSAEE